MSRKLKFNIDLTNGQKQALKLAHDDTVKYLVCCWSRQSGKSVFAELVLIEYLCKPNLFSAYISPTFQLGRKVFSEVVKLLKDSGLIKKANASTLTIESITGSQLQFFSVEAYTAIRGFTVSGVLICDEAAYYPDVLPNGEEIWGNVIMPITKARCKKTILISTPRGKRGFFFDFYTRALNKEDGFACILKTIYDDELVSPTDLEFIKNSVPQLAFEQEFECQFLDSSLTFFSGFEKCFRKLGKIKYQKTYIGIDLSGDGTDETILTKINQDFEVEQFKVGGTLDMKYRKIADIINSSVNLQYSYVEINGLGAPMLNEIKKLVKEPHKMQEWTTTNSTKEGILSNLAVKIANEGIAFDENDTELFSQFGTFVCNVTKTGKLQLSAMSGKKDDRIMSLAIALEATKLNKSYTKDNFVFIDIPVDNYNFL